MKRNIKIPIISLVLIVFALSGCNTDQEVAEPISTTNYPIATFELVTTETLLNEGDEPQIVYNVTLDRPSDRKIVISATIGGLVSADDYEVIDAVLAPYSTTAELIIQIFSDIEIEDTETITVQVGAYEIANQYLLNPSTTFPQESTFNIINYESPNLDMSFDWEMEIDFEGTAYSTCANVDIDIFIADAEGFDINDPFATWNDVMYAATGDCPEVMTFTPDNIPDGSYILFSELWANEFGGLGTNTPMPIRASFVRAGVFDVVYEQDASQAFNSDTPGVADPDYAGEVIDTYIAEVTIANGVFTIKGFDGSQVASGRINNKNRTPRPDYLMKK